VINKFFFFFLVVVVVVVVVAVAVAAAAAAAAVGIKVPSTGRLVNIQVPKNGIIVCNVTNQECTVA